jgi:hypothetical protein
MTREIKEKVGVIFAIVVVALVFNRIVDFNPVYKPAISMWVGSLKFLIPGIGFVYIVYRLFDS